MDKLSGKKMLGMPWWLFLSITVVVYIIGATGVLNSNMIGALCFALFVGTLAGVVGDHIPIWNKWLGGGMLFAFFVAGALNTFNLLPASTIKTLNTFNGATGFLDLYIVALITGSIMSVDRKFLMKAFVGYIPTICGGIIAAVVLGSLAATLVGINPMESIINIVFPIMGGGNGAGAIPMSQIWGDVTHQNPHAWYAKAFAILSLGNLVAVLFAAILNRIGQLHPSLTGNGQLMKGMQNESPDAVMYKPVLLDYAAGLGLGLVIYILADVYAGHLSLINTHHLGFTIHRFAFVVIFAAILNISNIIPANVKAGAKGMQNFFAKYMSFPLMITVGITTNLHSFVEVFTLANMFVIVMVVLGATIGTMLVGKLFHFYPIESAITAGLCMANGGGSGDVQVLGASNRMELMSFAQISSRIGGAIMLILASIVFGLYYA